MRGYDSEFVFGKIRQIMNSSWNKAWREAGLPKGKEHLKGVHNLRHTFGKRLRDAGVDERDIQDLLHHVPKNVTRMYSAPELRHLKACVEQIVPKPSLQAVR
jgi:integrase